MTEPTPGAAVNEIPVTLVGNVVTDVTPRLTPGGVEVASFRFACTDRRYDRSAGRWVDGNTSYVQVTCWRRLARNVVASVAKGDPLVVTGRLRVRSWERDDRRGVSVEVDASAVGHDLARGVTRFARPPRATLPAGSPEQAAVEAALRAASGPDESTTTGRPEGDDDGATGARPDAPAA